MDWMDVVNEVPWLQRAHRRETKRQLGRGALEVREDADLEPI